TPADSLALLRQAIEAGGSVWISYLDNHGTATERVVDPVRIEGGQLTAYDHRSEDQRTFAIHRLNAVRALAT
ncbi:MAG TPA: WYL domain-containing protein, partial [Nocardioides sp.]